MTAQFASSGGAIGGARGVAAPLTAVLIRMVPLCTKWWIYMYNFQNYANLLYWQFTSRWRASNCTVTDRPIWHPDLYYINLFIADDVLDKAPLAAVWRQRRPIGAPCPTPLLTAPTDTSYSKDRAPLPPLAEVLFVTVFHSALINCYLDFTSGNKGSWFLLLWGYEQFKIAFRFYVRSLAPYWKEFTPPPWSSTLAPPLFASISTPRVFLLCTAANRLL